MPKQQRKRRIFILLFVCLFFSMLLVECREGSLKRGAAPMEKLHTDAKFM